MLFPLWYLFPPLVFIWFSPNIANFPSKEEVRTQLLLQDGREGGLVCVVEVVQGNLVNKKAQHVLQGGVHVRNEALCRFEG